MNIETSWTRMEVKLHKKGAMFAKNAILYMLHVFYHTRHTGSLRLCSAFSRIFNVSRTNTLHVRCAMTFEAP